LDANFYAMPVFEFVTEIKAPIEVCFNVARSIDVHKESMVESNEKAIGGVTSGLIGPGEEVTWQATHFGIRQKLSSVITGFQFPYYFRDEMTKGPFKSIKHDHLFEKKGEITIMRDRFEFESPLGLLGKIFNRLVLDKYMKTLILRRNHVLKAHAESTYGNNTKHQ
jgi:ligand-binding SRPBCC domain-containing protein